MVPEPTRPTKLSEVIKPRSNGEGCDGDGTAPRTRIQAERLSQLKTELEAVE